MFKPVLGFVVVAAVLIAVLMLSKARVEPLKVSGFIEADEIRVGSLVGGRVAAVAVIEGQQVSAGDLLIQLEPFDLFERRTEAEAILAQKEASFRKINSGFRAEETAQAKAVTDRLKANLEKLESGPRQQEIRAAEAELSSAEAELRLAQLQQARVRELVEKSVETQQALDEANTRLEAGRETSKLRQERLQLLREGTRAEEIAEAKALHEEAYQAWKLRARGYRPEEVSEAEAARKAARAAVETIDRRIEELKITSPLDGTVEALELQPGDLVVANSPVLSLIDATHLWVRAYVPENRLDLNIGEELAVTVDSFPGRRFRGRISFIARQAEFVPGNVQTPEERSKQVFRIKVALEEGLSELRPGMAADVWLNDQGTSE